MKGSRAQIKEKRLPSELAGFSFDAGRRVTGAAGAGAARNSPLGEIRTPTGGILSRKKLAWIIDHAP
jgi:hypothetical protein